MHNAAQLVLLLIVLSDLAVLGTTRLTSCIRGLAAQGVLLGLLPLLLAPQLSVHAVSLGLGTVVVKAVVLPWFLVLTTRRKALMQVVGYLILENGIYLFGLTQTESVPFLIELGVLLDVFVGVFIMGIVVFHINREFDSLDSTRLTELSD